MRVIFYIEIFIAFLFKIEYKKLPFYAFCLPTLFYVKKKKSSLNKDNNNRKRGQWDVYLTSL